MGWNSTRHIGAGVVFELDGACHEPVRATTQEKIAGTLTCFGRVVVTGTLLSGGLYQLYGLEGCLWASSLFVVAATLLSSKLPRAKP